MCPDALRDATALLIAARVCPWPPGPRKRETQEKVEAVRSTLKAMRAPDFAESFATAGRSCATLRQWRQQRERRYQR